MQVKKIEMTKTSEHSRYYNVDITLGPVYVDRAQTLHADLIKDPEKLLDFERRLNETGWAAFGVGLFAGGLLFSIIFLFTTVLTHAK